MADSLPTAPQRVVSLPLGQARIAGRIDSMRRNLGQAGSVYRTLLKLPAPDSYSSPSTVEVRSTERLGAQGLLVKPYGREELTRIVNDFAALQRSGN